MHKSKRVIIDLLTCLGSLLLSDFWISLNCCSSIKTGLCLGADHVYFYLFYKHYQRSLILSVDFFFMFLSRVEP